MCLSISTFVYVFVYALKVCSLRGTWSSDTPIVVNESIYYPTPDFWIFFSTKRTEFRGEIADSRVGVGKIKDDWKYFVLGSEEVFKEYWEYVKNRRQPKGAPTGQIWDNLSIKVNNDGYEWQYMEYTVGAHDFMLM